MATIDEFKAQLIGGGFEQIDFDSKSLSLERKQN